MEFNKEEKVAERDVVPEYEDDIPF